MKKVILCLISFLLLIGCNKQTIIQQIISPGITPGTNPNDTTGTIKPNGSYTIKFKAGTNTFNTKAQGVSALQPNRYVSIYCFDYLEDFKDSLTYSTVRAGVLSPIMGNQLKTDAGNYEFYAIGVANSPILPPEFTDLYSGLISTGIDNGIDYIYSSIINKEITQDQDLTLVMTHMCSQVIIDIESANDNTLDSLSAVTIAPPLNTNSLMSLFTGKITQSKSLMDYAPLNMNIVGTSCNQILLPLNYSGTLPLTFTAYFNGSKTGKKYTANIPLVDSQLIAGNSYKYLIEIGESTVTFSNVVITNWVEVDETGTPIDPTQIN